MSTFDRKLRKLRNEPRAFVRDLIAKRILAAGEALPPDYAHRAANLMSSRKPVASIVIDGPNSRVDTSATSAAVFSGGKTAFLAVREARPGAPEAQSWDRILAPEPRHPFSVEGTRFVDVSFGPVADTSNVSRQLGFLAQRKLSPHTWPIAQRGGYLLAVDPLSVTPFMLRACWPDFRLITLLTRSPSTYAWSTELLHEQSDVIVTCGTAVAEHFESHRYRVHVDELSRVRSVLRSVVQVLDPRALNPFVPIRYSSSRALGALSDDVRYQHYDGILLRPTRSASYSRLRTFRDLLLDQFEVSPGFFLRASFANRYTSHVEGGRAAQVFLQAVADGARIAFVDHEGT